MKTKIEKFELWDFLILKQELITTKGESWANVLIAFEGMGLVKELRREKHPGGDITYKRTEKGKVFFFDTLDQLEMVLNTVMGQKTKASSTSKKTTIKKK